MGWKSYDFECLKCKHVFIDIVQGDENPDPCPLCGNKTKFDRKFPSPGTMTTVIPSYPGSQQYKAGYQHTHNRPAEKAASQVSMLPSKKR